MEMKSNTLTIVLLVVGLVVGAGAGYFLTPTEIVEQTSQPQPSTTYIQPTQPQQDQVLNEVRGLVSLVYGAIGAALVAALASILTLMQVSRRLG
jgi:hypothetical protein